MGYTPTFRGLIRINMVLAGAVISITFIFLLIAKLEVFRAVLLCAMGGFIVLVLGTANIYLLGFRSIRNTNDKLNLKQRSKRYMLSYLISPLIYVAIWIPFEPFINKDKSLQWATLDFISIFILSSWLINTLIILLYNYNFLYFSKIDSEMENLKLQALVSETSNQVLKQQIHPHFLFNVLNTVKTLYKQDLNQGEAYLVHLANFLRVSLSNPARIVRLESELQLCHDYIEMQRIRFGVALTYEVLLPDNIRSGKFVPYFAIQTLLENAIKHNELTEESPLNIRVTCEEECIKVTNNFQPRHFKETSTGQGLSNLCERYRLLSQKEIQIVQNENQFAVKINLLDNEDSHH